MPHIIQARTDNGALTMLLSDLSVKSLPAGDSTTAMVTELLRSSDGPVELETLEQTIAAARQLSTSTAPNAPVRLGDFSLSGMDELGGVLELRHNSAGTMPETFAREAAHLVATLGSEAAADSLWMQRLRQICDEPVNPREHALQVAQMIEVGMVEVDADGLVEVIELDPGQAVVTTSGHGTSRVGMDRLINARERQGRLHLKI